MKPLTGDALRHASETISAAIGSVQYLSQRGLLTDERRQVIMQNLLALCAKDSSEASPRVRAAIIAECREACMAVFADADEAAKAKDIEDNYKCGYTDAAIDCDEALFRMIGAYVKPIVEKP